MLLTFGHGTATQEQIVDLLRGAGVRVVVDVRTAPGSRRNPHVSRAELSRWLPEHGIAYRWERRLGGFRRLQPDSPDVVWRNPGLRGYAGYARTPTFVAAVDDLLRETNPQTADIERTAGTVRPTGTKPADVTAAWATGPGTDPGTGAAGGAVAAMCSETVWWRCHRRIVADFVVMARGVRVRHLMHDGRLVPHQPTPGARLRDDGLLVYDAGQEPLPPQPQPQPQP